LKDIYFKDLGLDNEVLKVIQEVGYDMPSPIQAGIIPYVLQGEDVIGQAQTGTGKTAAFALPILSNIKLKQKKPQVLVLAPTRELAIQVAESFQTYSKHKKNFHILPIYGGQDYSIQLKGLKRDPQVIVGTPGRVMDHIKRGTLELDMLKTIVLDEADEMLKMGFIDDVKWILSHTPNNRQIALFSATMPKEIRNIANKYLKNPKEVTIQMKVSTAETIRQRYLMVDNRNKIEALTRILEVEYYDGIIVFVRTKSATIELADRLNARGYATSALNGDMSQSHREKIVSQLKKGKLDILIGTDIVARGLDINRITHVINYDIPYDTESYIHRIGRTGRAGKKGEAILLISPREKNLLNMIERATKQKIQRMDLPSTQDLNDTRIEKFKQLISNTLATQELSFYMEVIESYQNESGANLLEISAALAKILRGDDHLLLDDIKEHKSSYSDNKIKYRVSVGAKDNVKTSNIVGAIANEANVKSSNIGKIKIYDTFSTVDLPNNLSNKTLEIIKNIKIGKRKLNIVEFEDSNTKSSKRRRKRRR
jgi:ATP-dependent RNA helicase DeaD